MKKILALVLCVLMIVGLFAGCNTEKPAGTTGTPGGDKPAGTTAPGTTADDGRSAIGELPIVTDGSKPVITIGINQDILCENYETNDYTVWIEEQTGIDLQFKYFADDETESAQQLNAMIAAGEKLPDILWHFSGMSDALRAELGADGYLVDVMPLINEYGYYIKQNLERIPEVNPSEKDTVFAYGMDAATGALYGVPHYCNQVGDATILGFYNTAFLETLGMEKPDTIEELYDYLVAVKTKDPNGNGKADEIPLAGRDGEWHADVTEWIINAFIPLNKSYFFSAENGEVYIPHMTNEYREALKFLNKLYNEGLFYPGYYTMQERAELKALVYPASGEAICGVVGGHPTLVMEAEQPLNTSYGNWVVLGDATGRGGYAHLDAGTYDYKTCITTDCEDVLLAYRLLDFMTSEESIIRQRYGNPGEHWDYYDGELTTSTGAKAAVIVHDGSAYTEQGNSTWYSCGGVVRPTCIWSSVFNPEGRSEQSLARSYISQGLVKNFYEEARHLPENLTFLVYNAEEQEVVTQYSQMVEDFAEEQLALFISGAKDPNSDADWEAYLKAMEQEGALEWLEVAQSAYTRMKG